MDLNKLMELGKNPLGTINKVEVKKAVEKKEDNKEKPVYVARFGSSL